LKAAKANPIVSNEKLYKSPPLTRSLTLEYVTIMRDY
jgi:hypothetical protein